MNTTLLSVIIAQMDAFQDIQIVNN